jgi:hypothetical protein
VRQSINHCEFNYLVLPTVGRAPLHLTHCARPAEAKTFACIACIACCVPADALGTCRPFIHTLSSTSFLQRLQQYQPPEPPHPLQRDSIYLPWPTSCGRADDQTLSCSLLNSLPTWKTFARQERASSSHVKVSCLNATPQRADARTTRDAHSRRSRRVLLISASASSKRERLPQSWR